MMSTYFKRTFVTMVTEERINPPALPTPRTLKMAANPWTRSADAFSTLMARRRLRHVMDDVGRGRRRRRSGDGGSGRGVVVASLEDIVLLTDNTLRGQCPSK